MHCGDNTSQKDVEAPPRSQCGIYALMAQQVEQLIRNQQVGGSSPPESSNTNNKVCKIMHNTVVFLDIDFVLNNSNTKERIGCSIGIEDEKILLLKDIVAHLEADIILTSSWREFWSKDLNPCSDARPLGSSPLDHGRYLNEKLAEHGLTITDKTPSYSWFDRASEVRAWLEEHPEVDRFVILDDEDFGWKNYSLDKHWVCTFEAGLIGYDGGLTQEHVDYIKTHQEDFIRMRTDKKIS